MTVEELFRLKGKLSTWDPPYENRGVNVNTRDVQDTIIKKIRGTKLGNDIKKSEGYIIEIIISKKPKEVKKE